MRKLIRNEGITMNCQKLLLLNLGTTSFKFQYYDYSTGETAIAGGMVEGLGGSGSCRIVWPEGETYSACSCQTCTDAFELCGGILREKGVLKEIQDLDAVGYKAVHGGPLSGTRLVDDELLQTMEDFVPLAPAHNPVYLELMRSLRRRYPSLTQAVRFETSFHATIPEYRSAYGVPYRWGEELGIRRYGFHGSSHEYIAGRMRELDPDAKRIISIHLGGSSSLCAIRDGKSIASSMGATPQTGLFQNNRVGDFDVCCIPRLVQEYGSVDAVMKILCTQSGLLGLSGVSNDLREVLAARAEGNRHAELAVRAFADNIVGFVGMFAAYLGGLDAIAFTGGIGQNCRQLREIVCENLGMFRARIMPDMDYPGYDCRISTRESGIAVWVIRTNEEQVLASHIRSLLSL